MRKYKVEFKQTETFMVDVYAKNEEGARSKAEERFNAGDYQWVGDCAVDVGEIYDVTDTDDPFNP